MSTSRTPSPPNTLPANIRPAPSRPPTHDPSPPRAPVRAHRSPSRPAPPHPPPLTPTPHARPEHSPRPAPAAAHPMAARLRSPAPPPDTHTRRSSPSSDSQDGMADTEMDASQGNRSEPGPPAAQPKKKRTRTLTLPHQSAALHALLAQSRFPTTAMREEVGRAIGLSARKVQIWFQNQRQKARRPRSGSSASGTNLPQYGAFPILPAPAGAASGLDTDPGPSTSAAAQQPYDSERPGTSHSAYGAYVPLAPYSGAPAPGAQLLGPGMPGAAPRIGASRHATYGSPPLSASASAPPSAFAARPRTQHYHRTPSPASPTRPYPSPITHRPRALRPADAALGAPTHDPARTLPPLDFSAPPPPAHRLSLPPHLPPPFAAPPPGPASAPAPASAAGAHWALPPPFTLQPQPQWDMAAYAAPLRPPAGRPDPRAAARGPPPGDAPPLARPARYDPVRAAIVHYAPPRTPSPGPSHPRAHDRPGDDPAARRR